MPELEDRVQGVLDALRPMIQADGGDIELVDVKDQVVRVRLKGACDTCPSSVLTLKQGVERMIREELPEIREVVAV